MRSSDDLPANPWPQDMQVGVEESWPPLTFLLFVRSTWHLPIDDVPRLDADPEPGSSNRPENLDVDSAVRRWLSEWRRAWTHFDLPNSTVSSPDEETQHLLDTLTDDELWEATATRPSDFWDSGIDHDAYYRWQSTMAARLGELPESRVVPALVAAWRDGLRTIIQLPMAGFVAHRINRAHLVVSTATRRDPDRYSQALTL